MLIKHLKINRLRQKYFIFSHLSNDCIKSISNLHRRPVIWSLLFRCEESFAFLTVRRALKTLGAVTLCDFEGAKDRNSSIHGL